MTQSEPTSPIVSSLEATLILGAGPVDSADLAAVSGVWGPCVCADGGLRTALEHGIVPACVVGDLDSARPQDLDQVDQVIRDTDQDTTDFEKCLARIEGPVILALGVLGGRLDHQLASLSAALKDPRPIVMVSGAEASVVLRRPLDLKLAQGAAVSLYPLLAIEAVTATGLVWPWTQRQMSPDGFMSTSNRMAQPWLRVEVSGPGLLITVSSEWIGSLMAALQAGSGQPLE